MNRAGFTNTKVFLISVFIFGLFCVDAFAANSEFEMMNKLEETERTAPIQVITRPEVQYNAQDSRDPFKGPSREQMVPAETSGYGDKPLPALTVQGIIWGGKFPQAIINNKVVKVGDIIEDTRVVSIDKDGVTVFFENQQYKLSSSNISGNKP